MKALSFLACLLISSIIHAQFVLAPLPFKQADFKAIKAGNYTKCSMYEIVDGNKVLVKEAEYGFAGMVATFAEKGTNNDGDSINTSYCSYKFDDKGRLVMETNEGAEGDDETVYTAYTYDKNGRLVEKAIAHIDPPTYKYKYDATGKLKEIRVTLKMPHYLDSTSEKWEAVDVPWTRYTVKCNAAGQVVEETEYSLRSEEKTPVAKYTWQYNAAGNIIKYTYKSLLGEDVYTINYTYNQAGLLIKSKETKTGDPDHSFVYEYCKGCKQSWK
jgi:YD repeat-containing protein